jgi:hypothetical protein
MCAVCDARLNQVPAAPTVGCKCKADTVDQSANGSLDCVLGVNPMICLQITHHCLQITHHCLQITHHCLQITHHCLQITHHSDALQLLAVGCSEAGWGVC